MWNAGLGAHWPYGKIGSLIAGISLTCSISFFFSWRHDNAILQQYAVAITKNLNTDSARIRAINDWVYDNKGFTKNHRYFIASALGPTPIQVMENGGDCADKSRLVAAMLNSLGIDAGLVMISPCEHCPYIHTVVEAQYEAGRMVVDPIWDVDYPSSDGRFFGVADLKGTNRGRDRVVELQDQRAATDKIARIPLADATFDHAVAVNWDKNILTRTIAATLRLIGYEPRRFFRPRFLEDPKLLLTILLIGGVGVITLAGFVLKLGGCAVRLRDHQRMPASDGDKREAIGT